jgi:hypothetical protein
MNDLDLRALVRDAVARHLNRPSRPGAAAPGRPAADAPPAPAAVHPAQDLYLTVVNTTDDCVIEPSVRCTHCGFCKTHGY